MGRTFAEKSVERRLLEQRLSTLQEDEEITYQAISELIGKDIKNGSWHYLQNAREWVLNHHNIVTRCIPTIGIKRLRDSAIVGAGLERTRHIRKTAGKGVKEMGAVQDFNALADNEKITHNAVVMGLTLARFATKSTTTKKIESKVTAQTRDLPIGRILEIMK